jgi:hypothetical protein
MYSFWRVRSSPFWIKDTATSEGESPETGIGTRKHAIKTDAAKRRAEATRKILGL